MDIRVDVGFFSHRKTKRLIATAGLQAAWSLLVLWAKMSQQRPKGVLFDMDEADIAMEAEWPGEASVFINALRLCGGTSKPGYIDRLEDGTYVLHGWEEHQHFVFTRDKRSQVGRLNAMKKYEGRLKRLQKELGEMGLPPESHGNGMASPPEGGGSAKPLPSESGGSGKVMASESGGNGIDAPHEGDAVTSETACQQQGNATGLACSSSFSSSSSQTVVPPRKKRPVAVCDPEQEKRNAIALVNGMRQTASPELISRVMSRLNLTEADFKKEVSHA